MNSWTQQTQQGQHATSLLKNRRRRKRMPPSQQGTHIWIDANRRVAVEVIDESSSGIGVILPEVSFKLGPSVDIDFGGFRRTATVAYLTRTDDQQYRLGLEWADAEGV